MCGHINFQNLSKLKTLLLKTTVCLYELYYKNGPLGTKTLLLRPHKRVCVIIAAVIRSDPVIPWYTNPAPWHIFRFPWGALSTSPRAADIFPLQESGICHVFLLIQLSNLHAEKALKYQMLQSSRYGILEKWSLFL